MKICVAQTKPVKGDILTNIRNHVKLVELALSHKAGLIIFPELSITGYEPELADELAVDKDDQRFNVFQTISDEKNITIGIGVPMQNTTGISISILLFYPGESREVYSKKYLHADEEGFFVSGESSIEHIGPKKNIALAICYEIFITDHAEQASGKAATVYIASALKSVTAMEKSIRRLSTIASTYNMIVLLSNSVGTSGGYDCGGRSSAWNNKGELIAQLNEIDEGVLVLDTLTQEAVVENLQAAAV